MGLDFDKELKVCEARKKAGVQFDFGYEVALRRLKRLREIMEMNREELSMYFTQGHRYEIRDLLNIKET